MRKETESKNSSGHKREVAIRDLFPNKTDEELEHAEEVLHAYFEVILRVCEDIENDPETRARYEKYRLEKPN